MLKLLILLTPIVAFALTPSTEVAFSPKRGAEELVLKAINSSQKSLCIASYSFTSKHIAEAILRANKRGVVVKVVSDYNSNSNKFTVTRLLANQGIAVRLNRNYAIMHNKFIVVDKQTVETGSFNYSKAANTKNAENVIVLWNQPSIAIIYTLECERLYNEANLI